MPFKVILLFCSLAMILCRTAYAQPKTELRIGAIASLSGPAAEQGRNWLEGAQLALEELQNRGAPVRLIVEDDATNASKSTLAFKKLVSIDKVQAIVGGTWDYLAESVFPLAAKYKIPFVTPSNPIEIFSETAKKNKYVFTNGLGMQASKAALANLIDAKKPKSIALVVSKVPFGILHADILQELAKQRSIPVLLREEYDLGNHSDLLRSLAFKLSNLKPELVLTDADYAALNIFASELNKFKFYPILVTTQYLDEAFALNRDNAVYRNAFGIYPSKPSPSFLRAFERKYGRHAKVYAAEGYDALHFLAQVLLKKIDVSKPGIVYAGATGAHQIRSDNRSLNDRRAVMMQVDAEHGLNEVNFPVNHHKAE